VCGLCLSTTSAGVRTGALLAMGKLLPAIEVDEARKMMAICGKVLPSTWRLGCLLYCSSIVRTHELQLIPASQPTSQPTVQGQSAEQMLRGCWPQLTGGG
jgi:hypothetical protein